jgi:hypothetical protein
VGADAHIAVLLAAHCRAGSGDPVTEKGFHQTKPPMSYLWTEFVKMLDNGLLFGAMYVQ